MYPKTSFHSAGSGVLFPRILCVFTSFDVQAMKFGTMTPPPYGEGKIFRLDPHLPRGHVPSSPPGKYHPVTQFQGEPLKQEALNTSGWEKFAIFIGAQNGEFVMFAYTCSNCLTHS